MLSFSRLSLFSILSGLCLQYALAQDLPTSPHLTADSLQISNAWARATAPHAAHGGAYLHIRNTGSESDKLLSVKVDASIAASVELHDVITDQQVFKMVKQNFIALPPHSDTDLKPKSKHIMLINIIKPLVEGERIPATLTFEQAGTIHIIFEVRSLTEDTTPHAH